MKSTRSGRIFSPYDECLHVSGDIERLLEQAFERSRDSTDVLNPDRDVLENTKRLDLEDVEDDEVYLGQSLQETEGAQNDSATPLAISKAEKDKRRRRQKRRAARERSFWEEGQPPKSPVFHQVMHEAQTVPSHLRQGAIQNLPSSSCGFQANREGSNREKTTRSYESLIAEGYEIVPWDGRTTKLITCGDKNTVIIACVGRESDDDWRDVCTDAYMTFKEARHQMMQSAKCKPNPRGNFTASLTGIIHGHGSTAAHNIRIQDGEETIEKLKNRKSVIRLANFASASFRMFAPKVYGYYHSQMKKLHDKNADLKRPFSGSVFACAGFNMGPRVATVMHRDCMNCPYGWCSVQALGTFDSKKGGHMVFEDLKTAVEFPSGSLILLPSATLKHGNTPVQTHEDRASFTQFTPGNLFRFIECGFQTEAQLQKIDAERYKDMIEEKRHRWQTGVSMWSTVDELSRMAMESNDKDGIAGGHQDEYHGI